MFPSPPDSFPSVENDLPEISQDEEFKRICDLREASVENVELGQNAPHLILTLDDGRVVFINGHDNDYEPWQTGESFVRVGLTVIACPGGQIALFGAEDLMEKR
jgi:hypothetical protein